jgi:hypothetical protein
MLLKSLEDSNRFDSAQLILVCIIAARQFNAT